jgi:hypothetical protein
LSPLDDAKFPKIIGARNEKEAWDILKLAYQGNEKVKIVRLQTLRTQFETLKMNELESVDQCMTKVMGIVNQLRINGEELAYQRVVEKVFRSLPKKFEIVVIDILESKDLTKFLVQELTGSLLSHEARINLDVGFLEQAFTSKVSIDNGKGRGKGFQVRKGRGGGHYQTEDRSSATN